MGVLGGWAFAYERGTPVGKPKTAHSVLLGALEAEDAVFGDGG